MAVTSRLVVSEFNGSVCFVISGLEFARGCVELGGLPVEQAIGQRAADTLVEEYEHQGDADAFVGQSIGIALALSLQ